MMRCWRCGFEFSIKPSKKWKTTLEKKNEFLTTLDYVRYCPCCGSSLYMKKGE